MFYTLTTDIRADESLAKLAESSGTTPEVVLQTVIAVALGKGKGTVSNLSNLGTKKLKHNFKLPENFQPLDE